jgi:hypothetical protein
MGTLIAFIFSMDRFSLVLILAIVILSILLWKAQVKKDSFDLRDLIVESKSHKVSLHKFGQFIALGISSWGFIYLTLNGKLTEMYFTTYMAAWSGIAALNNAIGVYERKNRQIDPKERGVEQNCGEVEQTSK